MIQKTCGSLPPIKISEAAKEVLANAVKADSGCRVLVGKVSDGMTHEYKVNESPRSGENNCEACLGAPSGQCFECFNFAQAELDETPDVT